MRVVLGLFVLALAVCTVQASLFDLCWQRVKKNDADAAQALFKKDPVVVVFDAVNQGKIRSGPGLSPADQALVADSLDIIRNLIQGIFNDMEIDPPGPASTIFAPVRFGLMRGLDKSNYGNIPYKDLKEGSESMRVPVTFQHMVGGKKFIPRDYSFLTKYRTFSDHLYDVIRAAKLKDVPAFVNNELLPFCLNVMKILEK